MSDRVDLFYQCYGKGEPLISLHGGPGLDSIYIEAALLPLKDHYTTLIYDQRCLGRSSGHPTTSTVENSLNDLASLQKQLALSPSHLLGHSWGALLALLYAIHYPERVLSLKLVSPIAITEKGMWETHQVALSRLSKKDYHRLVEMATSEKFLTGDLEAVNTFMGLWFKAYVAPTLAAEIAFDITSNTAKNWSAVNACLLRDLKRFDLRPLLPSITCPVQIIHGDCDVVSMDHIQEISQYLTKCSVITLKNCGHFPFWEASEQFYQAILPAHTSLF